MNNIVSTLRAMNEDGVNHVGRAADVIQQQLIEIARLIERLEEDAAYADNVLRPLIANLDQEKDHYIEMWADVCDENQRLLNNLTEVAADWTATQYELAESKSNDTYSMRLLAESQAREKVLRESLVYYMERGVSEHLYYHVKKTLAQPTDDTALKAALAAERERCANTCMTLDMEDYGVYPMRAVQISSACAEAIRALGD